MQLMLARRFLLLEDAPRSLLQSRLHEARLYIRSRICASRKSDSGFCMFHDNDDRDSVAFEPALERLEGLARWSTDGESLSLNVKDCFFRVTVHCRAFQNSPD